MIILNSAYFGPVQYFSCFLKDSEILIEQYDSYQKQSYRNRCIIMGANENLKLVIPVKKPSGSGTLMKDVRIDYDTDWQKLHYRSILSAYRSSPYYEYYIDDYIPFFHKRENFLIDLNTKITQTILRQLQIEKAFRLSEEYSRKETGKDYRDLIHPKKESCKETGFFPKEYTQVFSDRNGFLKNASIIDLLFNLGPESVFFLK